MMLGLHPLTQDRADDAVDVLCEAFHDYPFMRYVIGQGVEDYDHRLRAMVAFFTFARFVGDDLVLGATGEGHRLVGVTTVTRPGPRRRPPELTARRETLWQLLGKEARSRYESYGQACEGFWDAAPHFHANMVGVRRGYAGQGIGRCLLDAVHDASRDDPQSIGVALTTEDPGNVPLYEHLGYRVTGTAQISNTIRTWGFFRPNQDR